MPTRDNLAFGVLKYTLVVVLTRITLVQEKPSIFWNP